jgi:hypothetical protein
LLVGEFSTFVLGTAAVVVGMGSEMLSYLKRQEAHDGVFWGKVMTR